MKKNLAFNEFEKEIRSASKRFREYLRTPKGKDSPKDCPIPMYIDWKNIRKGDGLR